MSDMKSLLEKLVSFESITPKDSGCQDFMIDFLTQQGFDCQRFDNFPVANFFARIGNQAPLLVFAGHTDVVPVGDENKWETPPFSLVEKEGMLYGRGTADMKGSLAAMLAVAADFTEKHPHFTGSLGFLITSGEEGDDFHLGTPHVMAELHKQGIHLDFCIVGEPSSSKQVGDIIKIGRRGSLTGKLILHGKQGHVAYPHLAQNPIHLISPALAELTAMHWDEGNQYFPPTSLQITHIQAGGHAGNIIPGTLAMQFNFRFSTEQSTDSLKASVSGCFKKYGLSPEIQWRLNGEPFLTAQGRLLESCIKAIRNITDQLPELSTSGGTSDGRFIAPYGVEVIELGPVNSTIHQVNECVSLNDLEKLREIYYSICEQLLTGKVLP
ncbi:succinyl-diaminopimelate desuccinylase [Legionella micdadei]|uniref:Succinyl-diaminopimelate desuccinylase n=1 Tax=Legionella micdadei TaxID=451 RepID=A0A098GEZ7_LEGMI|nr:succinyl-diaminopimelate desuccinylase [Legionella micdadei]ARG97821.1 succinyl-diaminopimelate desuccinylase [Legionella micdadei]ARG99862.1 succinyl-diaminopimelate desuccinylase [Legionella micdadei]KTD28531.1 succinyl-diaminopimelate desuccinylase [Legionella micdadei]NSL19126.1 succinyl-diaminopimelate desuccinylase [Legionella micdadei]CEG60577.1 Succinyl-diaminopimelate desuccinylase [Legionella micdadei]